MNKSKVIQKGIEYIAHLENANAELLAENQRLRGLLPAGAAPEGGADEESAGMKRKKIKVEAESGRFLLCVLAWGVVAVTVSGNSPAGAASNHHGVHTGGRVLAGAEDPEATDTLTALLMYWAWRFLIFVVCAAAYLKEDVVTDPAEALQNEAKCKAAEGNAMKQKSVAPVIPFVRVCENQGSACKCIWRPPLSLLVLYRGGTACPPTIAAHAAPSARRAGTTQRRRLRWWEPSPPRRGSRSSASW